MYPMVTTGYSLIVLTGLRCRSMTVQRSERKYTDTRYMPTAGIVNQ